MRILRDQDGNIFKANIVSSVPEGFEDITDTMVVEGDAVDLHPQHQESVLQDEKEAIAHVSEHWTDGDVVHYDANDIPTLTDEDGNPYLDPSFVHVAEIQAADVVPAHYVIKKSSTADQEMRQIIIDKLSTLRIPLLAEADIEINKLADLGQDASAWRDHRQALRDVTEPYKKVDGDWKVITDSIDLENFTWPVKPSGE